jgi:signal transduction histidine kinase
VVLGAVLWTIGLFTVAGVAMTVIILQVPDAGRTFHRPFTHTLPALLLALGCMLWGLAEVRWGLLPIERLRARLLAVRDGRHSRIEGEYPSEVQPLVSDLNALLDQRERAVKRAQAKAGDLAHGLKTPLAVLAQEAERAAAAGHTELAALLRQQVERMRGQVDYHLAQAGAAAGATATAHCFVRESAEGLARTLLQLHAERGLAIDVAVDSEHAIRGRREDLDEMLGNLLDNACKWASSRVRVGSALADTSVVLTVDDDGPGLDPALRERVLQRGVRADEAAPGTGIGLAIVRDLAELYGGRIALERSPTGGLRAELRLPARGRADVSDAG